MDERGIDGIAESIDATIQGQGTTVMTDLTSITQVERTAKYLGDDPEQSRLWAGRYLLFVKNLTAVFDGFKAVDIEALGVEHNELRVIIGPNGAGKTTFCDLVSGKTPVTTGKVFYDGDEITHVQEVDIARRGIGRKFQTPTVFDSLTTFENLELSLPGRQGLWSNLLRATTAAETERIEALLERVRLTEVRDTEASQLSHGQRQWLAISALILTEPKLLLVDEPAAGLTDAETALTAELLLELRADHTLIVIEHDMDFVRQLDSFVTVLNEGIILAEGTLQELQANPEVIEAYLGR
jgi:urea transport system ATP-binding protein